MKGPRRSRHAVEEGRGDGRVGAAGGDVRALVLRSVAAARPDIRAALGSDLLVIVLLDPQSRPDEPAWPIGIASFSRRATLRSRMRRWRDAATSRSRSWRRSTSSIQGCRVIPT
jgi:hypothetical protein